MTVVREYTISELSLKDQFVTSQETVTAGQSLPSNMLLQGATLRTSTSFGRAATVKAGEDIRPALESLRSAGGGTLILLAGVHKISYDIVGGSKINIIGEGRDQTIIECSGGAYGIKYIGVTSAHFDNFKLADFTIQNSNAAAAIDIDYSDFFVFSSVKTTSNDQGGVRVKNSTNFEVGVVSTQNTGNGISFTGCSNGNVDAGNISDNTGKGIEFVATNSDIRVNNNTVDGNGSDGIKLTATSDQITISSSTVSNNGGYGINIAVSTCDNNYIIAPTMLLNTSGNINDQGVNTVIISNLGTNGIVLPAYYPINGSVSPVPVFIESDGTLLLGEADDSELDDFDGFVNGDYSAQTPAVFLNGTVGSNRTTSHTVNAGTDRIVIVSVNVSGVLTTTGPSGVTWNGNAMTKFLENQGSYSGISVWYYVAGTGAQVTGNVVITGGTDHDDVNINHYSVFCDNYQYVDQADPFQDTDIVAATSGTSVSTSLTTTQSYGLTYQLHNDRVGNDVTMAFANVIHTADTSVKCADTALIGIQARTVTSSRSLGGPYSATERGIAASFTFKNSVSTDVTMYIAGVVSGFSGLTPGEPYYLSNTRGEISTSPGSTSLRVGKALSATDLNITQP